MIVKNKAFRTAMNKADLGTVELDKDYGCFAIFSDDTDMDLRISCLEDAQICGVFAFNQLSVAKWVSFIKEMIESVSEEDFQHAKNFDLDAPIHSYEII